MRRTSAALSAWVVIGLGGLAATVAHAETVVAQTGLISGSQSYVFALNAPGAGTFNVHLENLAWPDRLATLSFAASTSSAVLKRFDLGADLIGDSSFKVDHGGSYYALVSGTAQGALNMGLYSLKVDFAPVPLPAAAWLLFSSLAGFGLTQRKRHVARLA